MARILLTGGTSGIGLAAARRLAEQPHELILHGPEPEQAAVTVVDRVVRGAHPRTTVAYVSADFTDLDAVGTLAEQVVDRAGRLDALVNNAAVPGPPSLTVGAAGTDLTYQVNYLAGVLLTHLLLPYLEPDGRIVNVASATHLSATLDLEDLAFRRRAYSPSAAYAQSKLAVVTWSSWLAGRIGQTVVSVHPGVVATGLLHAMFAIDGVPPTVGGDNLAAALSARVPSGTYLDETAPSEPSAASLDTDLQRRLVADTTERLAVTLP